MGIEAAALGNPVESTDDLVGLLRARLSAIDDAHIAGVVHTTHDLVDLLHSCTVDLVVVDTPSSRVSGSCRADDTMLRVVVLTPLVECDGGATRENTPIASPSGIAPALSRRELDVLRAVASRGTAQAAATELSLSPNTVRNHLARVLAKLGVHTALEAVVMAIREQMIDVSDVGGRRVS